MELIRSVSAPFFLYFKQPSKIFIFCYFSDRFFPHRFPMYPLLWSDAGIFGQGMIYTVILATVQRWFPDRTGFASGVVVTANGLCGFFLAPLSRKLLEAEGVQKTFLIIGAAIAVSWILCGIFFRHPIRVW